MELESHEREFQETLEEMKLLSETAGAEILEVIVQKRNKLDSATVIGSGKLAEIKESAVEQKPDLIIFVNDLKPSQERNLSQALDLRVIDRQALILDIFSMRARTREGKMQVELALLNYLLPRLAGLGPILSRLGGGIGTRGPGETMLETDKRHVRRRIQTLRQELDKLRSHRTLLRQSRRNKGFLQAGIVGYTNAGKSTLLNRLTEREVLVENKLFATLDPTVGKFFLKSGVEVLLADTVGFIRNLPQQLLTAFRATLEEVEEADIILHVVDVSHPNLKEHMEVTEGLLEDMACDNKPVLLIFNKMDLTDMDKIMELKKEFPSSIFVSALSGRGLDALKEGVSKVAQEYFPTFVERFKKVRNGYTERKFTTQDN